MHQCAAHSYVLLRVLGALELGELVLERAVEAHHALHKLGGLDGLLEPLAVGQRPFDDLENHVPFPLVVVRAADDDRVDQQLPESSIVKNNQVVHPRRLLYDAQFQAMQGWSGRRWGSRRRRCGTRSSVESPADAANLVHHSGRCEMVLVVHLGRDGE